jgi:hypothetical protein
LAKFALKAHALVYLERLDDPPLDLLSGLSGSFIRSPVLPSRLIKVEDKAVAFDCYGLGR